MRHIRILTLILFTSLIWVPWPQAQAQAGNTSIAPPDSSPYGLTYAQWGARWWQWIYSIPLGVNPGANDTTGAQCSTNQSGPVWFLAGTFGGTPVTRACTIPTGRGIFFPIVNYLNDYPCPEPPSFEPKARQSVEDFLTQGAQAQINPVNSLEVKLDGSSLTDLFDFRATSKLFGFTGAHDLGTGVKFLRLAAVDTCVTGAPQLGVTDGYWIMLWPLSVGSHTLHFKASASRTSLLDVTYNLSIVNGK
jgi:hypothetical protein